MGVDDELLEEIVVAEEIERARLGRPERDRGSVRECRYCGKDFVFTDSDVADFFDCCAECNRDFKDQEHDEVEIGAKLRSGDVPDPIRDGE